MVLLEFLDAGFETSLELLGRGQLLLVLVPHRSAGLGRLDHSGLGCFGQRLEPGGGLASVRQQLLQVDVVGLQGFDLVGIKTLLRRQNRAGKWLWAYLQSNGF